MYLLELQFCLNRSPGVDLLDHMVVLYLIFCGPSRLFSIVDLYPFTFPPTLEELQVLFLLSPFLLGLELGALSAGWCESASLLPELLVWAFTMSRAPC